MKFPSRRASHHSGTVAEMAPNGTSVTQPLASSDPDNAGDPSDKQSLKYTVVNNVPFKVDPATQELVKDGVSNLKRKSPFLFFRQLLLFLRENSHMDKKFGAMVGHFTNFTLLLMVFTFTLFFQLLHNEVTVSPASIKVF